LESLGFKANPHDICVFNKGSVNDGSQCTIAIHVDDLMITCKDQALIDKAVSDITNVYKEVSVRKGKTHPYLGMMFDFAKQGKVKVTMDGYVTDLLDHFEVRGKAKTPAIADLFTVNEEATKLNQKDKESFHSKTAKLLYLGKRVRPDLLTAVVFLTTRVQSPDIDDAKKLERVLMHLNGTRELGLILEPSQSINVTSYVDASYGVHINGKIYTG
jgi:histone deacetylase 1/2